MNSQYFILGITILALGACAVQPKEKPQPQSALTRQSFLMTGRGLSNGAVDLYQPGSDFVTPAPSNPVAGTSVSSIPSNNHVMVSDPSVTIYNLDVEQISEPAPAPLPPLQPPTSLRGDYPSPFPEDSQ